MRRLGLTLPLLLSLLALPCAAEVQVSLPLQGYYRAGRYMPVRVVVRREKAGELTLSASGAVTTTLQLNGRAADAIVPLLVVRDPLGPITWMLPDGRQGRVEAELTPLGEQDRLVGFTDADAAAATPLFAGKSIIPVPLDPSRLLHKPVPAWEALDAVVLDERPVGALPFLTASGTAVVVRGEVAPKANWLPWRRVGDAWVMAQQPLGPRGAIVPEAYEPAYGWKPGRPMSVRRDLLLIAVVFAILALALTLWRSRLALVVTVVLSAGATAALAYRAGRQGVIATAQASVFVRRGENFQADHWTYFKSIAPTSARFQPGVMTKPVFASPTHAERCGLKLACDPEGLPTKFLFQLNTDTAMAFITREAIHRASDKPPDSDARASPLWPLVRLAYLGPGARAAGEVPADAGAGDPEIERHWPGIVIEELRR